MALKLLFYTNAFGGGGAEVVFARLALELAKDHEVIFAADHADRAPVDLTGVRTIRLPADHLAATRALARLLAHERPDASFSALGAHNLKHVAAATMARRRDRCVLGIHGFAAAEPQRLSRLAVHATPLLTRLAAQTICVSDILREEMIRRWHADTKKTIRIHNPVASATADPAPASPPIVLACGRLVPLKRFSDLVAAFARVEPRSARLVILGEGPERAAIEAAVARHGLQGRVELPGHLDPAPFYARAACLAVTSESESFGLTIAEALSYGLPVVATDCGGPREILADGAFGTLVPVGDQTALAAALSATLARPGDAEARLARGREFALPTIAEAYVRVATQLAGQDADRDHRRSRSSSVAKRSAHSA